MIRIRGSGREPGTKRPALVDAFFQNLALLVFLVIHQLAGILRGIELTLHGVDTDTSKQTIKSKDGAYVRKEFFGKHPEAAAMVANMSDDEIWHLNRGGHDPQKVHAAYDAAMRHTGQPTIILAKTIKGYGMGSAGEGQNTAHQQKKLDLEALKEMRDRFNIPVSDKDIEEVPYYKPAADSVELEYMMERRQALGGSLPQRRKKAATLPIPSLQTFKRSLMAPGARSIHNYGFCANSYGAAA